MKILHGVLLMGCLGLAAMMLPAAEQKDPPAKKKKGKAKAKPRVKAKKPEDNLKYPPVLPEGKASLTDTTPAFLEVPASLPKSLLVAKTAPTVEFQYFPGQDYRGNPWSNWGESVFAAGKYFTAIGDHLAPAGNAYVYVYDPSRKSLQRVVDLRKTLALPDGHYTPGKIHSRLDLGKDGWLYFATHRGSTRATVAANHYKGDWILRYNPESGKTEVVAQGPVPKHCIPVSVTDTDRLIFYGSTEPGEKGADNGKFFAYDLKNRKVLAVGDPGPSRAILLARSTGRAYYTKRTDNQLMRFDPAQGAAPVAIPGKIGIRAASTETADGIVYSVSHGSGVAPATIHAFDVKTEKIRDLGPAWAGTQQYITALAIDPKGRYLYYCPGAHGGAYRDGSPVVQFDTKTKQHKVLAFLEKHYQSKYGFSPRGTYNAALDEKGEKLFLTWNISRGSRHWDCCGMTVVHIPESERQP